MIHSFTSSTKRATRNRLLLVLFSIAAIVTASASAKDRSFDEIIEPIAVTDRVFYLYGSLENRTPINRGLNANLGFVVTDDGVVLIDTGPSHLAAAEIQSAIEAATGQPIRLIVNLGSQDHRWLGNDFFAEQGLEIVALKRTADTQANQGDGILTRMAAGIGDDELAGTRPLPATRPVDAEQHDFELGNVAFSLRFAGDAHFPGDAFLYLPDESVVFTGDIVYTERMLGIHSFTNPVGQLAAFRAIESLEPQHVVPGHGRATNLDEARRDTGNYLATVIKEVRAAIDDWRPIDEVVEDLSDFAAFRHLRHYDDWHRRNVHATYLFLEANPDE
ncbi:MAG: MBL fold metallo-hydrolase [Thioalkalivibrionaceae bacterium]